MMEIRQSRDQPAFYVVVNKIHSSEVAPLLQNAPHSCIDLVDKQTSLLWVEMDGRPDCSMEKFSSAVIIVSLEKKADANIPHQIEYVRC